MALWPAQEEVGKMATLLELADQLITTALRNNVYSDLNQFSVAQTRLVSQAANVAEFVAPPIDTTKRDDLNQNLYNDGPISIIKGGKYALNEAFVGPLRNFDVFAIAHWLRNVGSEVYFLPKFVNDPISKNGSFQGPVRTSYPGGPNGAETVIKSTTWLASQFLLASLNKGDTQAYGPLNLVWNPLSFPSALLPARGLSPTERPTIGNMISTYKDNLELSVAASQVSSLNPLGERLLLMRSGLYIENSPVKRLQQIRSPIGPPGFRGALNGAKQDTLDKEIPGDPTHLLNSIDMSLDGNKDTIVAKLGLHTNLYNQERPYGLSNAAAPLEKLEEFVKKFPNATELYGDVKANKLFDAKPFPRLRRFEQWQKHDVFSEAIPTIRERHWH